MFSFPYAGPDAYFFRVDGFKWYVYFVDLVKKHDFDGCGPQEVKYIGKWFADNSEYFSRNIGKDAALIDIPEIWNEEIHGLLRKKAAKADLNSREILKEISEIGDGFFLLISDGRIHEANNIIAINVVENIDKNVFYDENSKVLDALMRDIASAIRHDDISYLLEVVREYRYRNDGRTVELIEVGDSDKKDISSIFVLKPSMFGVGFDLKEAYNYFIGDRFIK